MAEEFAQAGGMLTFLSYEYGLGLKQDLKFSYEREEERRKDALVQKVKDQVASLNKRLQKAEISPEEYILKLEEQIKVLEKQCERMEMLRKEVDRLKVNENKLLADMKIAYLDISKLKSEILAKEYEKIQALDEAQRECSQKMAALTDALNAEKLEATAKLIEEINQLQGKIGDLIEINRSESDEMQKTLNMKTEEYNTLMFEFEKTREEKRFAEARLKSYRFKNHDMTDTDDYTDKDSFDELENELEVFIKFYKKEWTRTKRRIRKDLLNIKNIRKQNEHE
jgi:chromosome segregation ATPase